MDEIKHRLYMKSAHQRLPLTGAFELLPMCNFSCPMCYVRKTKSEADALGGVQTTDFWLQKAEEACKAGTLFPLLTGGEAFIHPDIRTIYETMVDMGMQVSINSNGSCITEEQIEWLTARPPVRINITLYAASNEGYERFCGDPRGFDKVSRATDLLDQYGIRYQFNCSLTPENAPELEKILEFGQKHGKGIKAASYMFPPVRRVGKTGDYSERFTPAQAAYYKVLIDYLQLPPERFRVLAENVSRFVPLTEEKLAEMAAGEPRTMGCMAGRCSYWIDWQGRMSACGMHNEPNLSLKDCHLTEAWQKIVDDTNAFRYGTYCANCPNRGICFSCKAMVCNETGETRERPVYLCRMLEEEVHFYREFLARMESEDWKPRFLQPEYDPDDCL